MSETIARGKFEKAINSAMNNWKIVFSHLNSCGLIKHLSCKSESGMEYKYRVVLGGVEQVVTCDYIEALEVYNSIKR